MILSIPKRGLNKGSSFANAFEDYSSNMNNVRMRDVLEGRMRIGQRPALVKWSTDLAGGATQPVVSMCSVSAVV